MRERGYFGGPVDGQASPALAEAIRAYRDALTGFDQTAAASGEPGDIDLAFFTAYLDADHATVLRASPPPAPPPGASSTPTTPNAPNAPNTSTPEPAPIAQKPSADATTARAVRAAAASTVSMRGAAPATRREPLRVSIESLSGESTFGRGQAFELVVFANRTAYVHCYFRDERRIVRRVFPHAGRQDALVRAGESITLPGNGRFHLVSSVRGITEAVVCYATDNEAHAQLPTKFRGGAFEPLAITNVEELRRAFRRASNDMFAEGVFYVRAQ